MPLLVSEMRPLPPSVDLAAYRVLQESLTNVVKHSAHPHAVVEVGYRPGAVRLRVANQDLGCQFLVRLPA